MKNQSLKRTDEKYLEVLFRIKHECEMGGNFSLSELIRDYSAGNAMGVVIQDAGIVRNVGHKNRPTYVWKSINPNIKMAERVRQEMTKRVMSYQKPKVKNKKRPVRTENIVSTKKDIWNIKETCLDNKPKKAKVEKCNYSKEKTIGNKNISILWGMIKIEL